MIIRRKEEETMKHVDKEKYEAYASYFSIQLKEEDVAASHFSSEGMQATMAPKITKEVT